LNEYFNLKESPRGVLFLRNEEGKESLENAKEHLENIESENKRISNLETWRTKIFLALAK
jgi:hypothetical protein